MSFIANANRRIELWYYQTMIRLMQTSPLFQRILQKTHPLGILTFKIPLYLLILSCVSFIGIGFGYLLGIAL
jgi:hypothetical protein